MAVSLLSTVLLECAFAFAVLKIRKPHGVLTVMLVNVMTNPVVVCLSFLSGYFGGSAARLVSLIVLEIAAIAAEGAVYKRTLREITVNPWIVSLILNALSYTVGLAINKFVY